MALHAKREGIPERKGVRTGEQGSGTMTSWKAYGNECSLMIAERAPGYHTRPHAHASEQINYVLEGEIWFFVEDRGYCCRKGDFQRIPANRIHWAWNRAEKNALVAEAHAPGLIGGKAGEGAVPLFDERENPEIRGPGGNQYVPYDADAVERNYFGR